MWATYLIVKTVSFLLYDYVQGHTVQEYAILEARPMENEEVDRVISVCILYNSKQQIFPEGISKSYYHMLFDSSHTQGCTGKDFNTTKGIIKNKVVAVSRGHCTFVMKAQIVQMFGGIAVLIVDFLNSTKLPSVGGNASEFKKIQISIANIGLEDYRSIINLSESVMVSMFSPPVSFWDTNMIIVIIGSTSIVMIGAAWSMYDEWQLIKRLRNACNEPHTLDQIEEPKADVAITVCSIVIWFISFCGIILLLYFLYDYMVYFVICAFSFCGSLSLYHCLLPVWSRILPIVCDVPLGRVPCIRSKVQLRNCLLLLLCFTTTIFWFIERNAKFAWILQDIIGVSVCIFLIHTIRLPNLIVITVLFILLLLYDAFFVYITPYITSDGKSIMESVATGGRGHSNETLPMVFLVPTLPNYPVRKCLKRYFSLLGFGDVVIPGLLVAYNGVFDVRKEAHMLYYFCSSLGYFLGMTACMIAIVIKSSGQPALVFLVPGTLLSTIAVAFIRKESGLLFWGFHKNVPVHEGTAKSKVEKIPQEEIFRVPVNEGKNIFEDEGKNIVEDEGKSILIQTAPCLASKANVMTTEQMLAA